MHLPLHSLQGQLHVDTSHPTRITHMPLVHRSITRKLLFGTFNTMPSFCGLCSEYTKPSNNRDTSRCKTNLNTDHACPLLPVLVTCISWIFLRVLSSTIDREVQIGVRQCLKQQPIGRLVPIRRQPKETGLHHISPSPPPVLDLSIAYAALVASKILCKKEMILSNAN